jgi:hypothetical protein
MFETAKLQALLSRHHRKVSRKRARKFLQSKKYISIPFAATAAVGSEPKAICM